MTYRRLFRNILTKISLKMIQNNLRMRRIAIETKIYSLEDIQRLNEATVDYVCRFITKPTLQIECHNKNPSEKEEPLMVISRRISKYKPSSLGKTSKLVFLSHRRFVALLRSSVCFTNLPKKNIYR